MKKTMDLNKSGPVKRRRPALTPEARENLCISMAYDMAQEQLENRTASSQVIAHFLKQGTVKAQLELERERKEIELIKAKAEALSTAKRVEELYAEAIAAMKIYSGQSSNEEEEFDDEDY